MGVKNSQLFCVIPQGFVRTHAVYNTRANANTNYRPWVMMASQCSFIIGDRCTPLVGNVHKGQSWA